MKTKLWIALLTGGFVLGGSLISFAGEWKEEMAGWWYQDEDGTYPSDCWREIDGKSYYFGSDGYMLSNTVTPDGYKVGADGAWIREESKPAVSKDYFEKATGLAVLDDEVIYSVYTNQYDVYHADLNGANQRKIIPEVGDFVIGPDGKLYYTKTFHGVGMYRCNTDGSGNELVYEVGLKESLGMTFRDSILIRYADAYGVQTDKGYYNIATGQMDTSVEPKKPEIDDRLYQEASSGMKAMIPHHDYSSSSVRTILGDYMVVTTYVVNTANAWYAPSDLVGYYILNIKTGNCVAYKKGKKFAPITDAIGTLEITDIGLIGYGKDGIYRIENGGDFVKLMDKPSAIYRVFKGNSFYYVDFIEGLKIQTFEPSALPTDRVY